MAANIFKWVIFRVLIGLFPIGMNVLRILIERGNPSLEQILGRGELLLVASAIAAGGIAELFAVKAHFPVIRLLTGGGCVATLLIASYMFAATAGRLAASLDYDAAFVVRGSLTVYSFNLLAALGCVIVTEVEKSK